MECIFLSKQLSCDCCPIHMASTLPENITCFTLVKIYASQFPRLKRILRFVKVEIYTPIPGIYKILL